MDYKYAIQLEAEELAEETEGKDFYSLSKEKQSDLYGKAEEIYTDKLLRKYDKGE